MSTYWGSLEQRAHLVAVVCDPPSLLGYRDSWHLSQHADQLADCLLIDPVWPRAPSVAAPTTLNTKGEQQQ